MLRVQIRSMNICPYGKKFPNLVLFHLVLCLSGTSYEQEVRDACTMSKLHVTRQNTKKKLLFQHGSLLFISVQT